MSTFRTAVAALSLTAAASAQAREERWLESLFYARMSSERMELDVTADDLDGSTIGSPAERVERVQARIEDEGAGAELELELVRALFAADRGDEGRELLQDLWRRQEELVEEDPEDYEEMAALGLVAFAIGTHFRERDALNASLQLLTTARQQDHDVWLAPAGLAQVLLFRGIVMQRSGEEEKGRRALQRARSMALEAVEIDEDRMLGHALVFLTGLLAGQPETPRELGTHLVRMSRDLVDAAELAQEPDVARAIGCTYMAVGIAGPCQEPLDSIAAFEELADEDDALGRAAGDAEELVEGMAGLEEHERLWPAASFLRWWLARHAELDEAPEYLEAAVEAADDPDVPLQGAVTVERNAENWDTGAEYAARLLEEPLHEHSRYVVGCFEAARGDLERAGELFEQSYEQDELSAARVGLAITLLRQDEDRERAIELLEEALEEDGDSASARFALGVARALEGDEAAAIDELEEALDLVEGEPSRSERIEAVLGDLEDDE